MAPARLFAALFALALAACEEERKPAAPPPAPPPKPVTLTYTRSGQDGTMPERIIVHILSREPARLEVVKMVAPCTDAAYVTAQAKPDAREMSRLVGGRLTRELTQAPQAWIDVDRAADKFDVRLGDPAAEPVETHAAPRAPWRLYDFDLAEFAVFGPRGVAGPDDFNFGLALAWPDRMPLVRVLGEAHADFVGAQPRNGILSNRYRISGGALGRKGGDLWLDAKYGHVVEASFGQPNHPGYKDFLLKLDSVAFADGDKVWRDALAAHWKDCPA